MSCELIAACPFFNKRMKVRPDTLTLYRVRYCRGAHGECARYLVYQSLGRAAVPADMYPNDRLKAMRLLNQRSGSTTAQAELGG